MRKFLMTAVVSLIFSCYLFSQDNTADKQRPSFSVNTIDSPLIVIKGEEISRFPSSNFLDAVNGLFPWVFSQTPDPNNFLFVIDGYVLTDINGISLYDIDEIVFTRNKLEGNLYPLARAGTFYITTKKSNNHKPLIRFNSQYDLRWNRSAVISKTEPSFAQPIENNSMNKGGHFLSNQVSLSFGGKKFDLHVSAALDMLRTPHVYQRSIYTSAGFPDTIDANAYSRQTNIRSFLNFRYQFSRGLTAGITGNYFHGNTKIDTSQRANLFNASPGHADAFVRSSIILPHYHLGAFINYEPLPNLRNKVSFEYSFNRFTIDRLFMENYYRSDTVFYTTDNTVNAIPKEKMYILRDKLDYDFIHEGKFRMRTSLLFSYLYDKYDVHSISSSQSPYGMSVSYYYIGQKFTTLSPSLHFSFSNFLSGYAGTSFILNKTISRYTDESKRNPFAGVSFDIRNLLNLSQKVNRLDISVDYGNMTENASFNYWLSSSQPSTPYLRGVSIYGSSYPVFVPLAQPALLKNKLTAIQLNSGFLHNRLLFGAGWSNLQSDQFFLVPAPNGFNQNVYIATIGKQTQTGTDLYAAVKIIDKPGRQWNMRLNVLFPHIKYTLDNGAAAPVDFPLNYTAQAGLQNNFRFKEFYLEANALLGFNQQSYYFVINSTQLVKKEFNDFGLNYLLVGYDLSKIKKPVLKGLSVFVQARNLLSSKKAKDYYQYDNYAGIGVNLKLQ